MLILRYRMKDFSASKRRFDTIWVVIGPRASAELVPAVVANGATAFLIILAMTVGLILPRMLFERFATARLAS